LGFGVGFVFGIDLGLFGRSCTLLSCTLFESSRCFPNP
jgi:hypothetical protein